MGVDDLIKDSNVQKYGLFFWVMLSGVAVMIAAIDKGFATRYCGVGLILILGGAAGYCISELMDRISASAFKNEENNTIKPPLWYHIINVVLKALVFIVIFIAIQYYYNFLPPTPFIPKN